MAYEVAALGTRLEYFSSGNKPNSAAVLSSTRIIAAYTDSVNDGFVRAFDIDRGTGVITGLSSAFEYDNADSKFEKLNGIDATNAVVTYQGVAADGFIQLLTINAGTGAVTANGSKLEFDTTDASFIASELVDSTHLLVVWSGVAGDGFAQVFTLDTALGVVAGVGTPFEFNITDATFNSLSKISATKWVVFYTGPTADGNAIVLDVSAVTFAVTAAGANFNYKNGTFTNNASDYLYTTGGTAVVVASYFDGTNSRIRTFNVDTTTWAITARGAEYTYGNSATLNANRYIKRIDDTHFLSLQAESSTLSNFEALAVDSGSGDITSISEVVVGATNDAIQTTELHDLGSGLWLGNWWSDVDDGALLQLFTVATPAGVTNHFLTLLGSGT